VQKEFPMDGPVSTPHRFLVPTAITLIGAGAVVLVVAWLQPDVTVTGVADGGSFAPGALRDVQITAHVDPAEVEVILDGAPAPVRRDDKRFLLDASSLPEGEHTILITSPDAAMPLPGPGTKIDFTVDATAPAVLVDPVAPTALDASAEVKGRVDEHRTSWTTAARSPSRRPPAPPTSTCWHATRPATRPRRRCRSRCSTRACAPCT
jgi:hypothetical protein